MSGWKDGVSRRPLLMALGGILGVGAVTGGVFEANKLWRSQPGHTPYEDLLAGVGDRSGAVMIGRAVLAVRPAFEAKQVAHDLRKRLHKQPLSALLAEDVVQGRVIETQGWVLPESLAQVCALAAKAS